MASVHSAIYDRAAAALRHSRRSLTRRRRRGCGSQRLFGFAS